MTLEATAPAHPGQGAKSVRAYVLGALLVVYIFNFIDRTLISILQEPIRDEFSLSDLQLGLLGGLAFAFLYTLLGIPIAYVAERTHRITIISIGLALWSAATAACGFAGTFTQLLLARVGVGVGEAACSPPSHSVISDYFPASRRASALAIYALGVPIGAMLAALGGGWLAQTLNWRIAFMALGLPGILIALLVQFTVKEPQRTGATQSPPFGQVFSYLLRKPTFWHVAFGGALVAFVGYGNGQFLVSFFVRGFGLSLQHASWAFAAVTGVSAALGTFLGGFLVDRLTPRFPNALSWLPALGFVIAMPLYIASFLQPTFELALAFVMGGAVFHYFYLGPMFAVAQSVAEPRMRAVAAAISLFVINIIGYGLGPPAIGALSDIFRHMAQAATPGISDATCHGVTSGPCAAAAALGLRQAMMAGACVLLWAALHFWLSARTLQRDRAS